MSRSTATVVKNPSTRLVPERVTLAIDGATCDQAAPVTIILNKPRGYVTTRSDPEGRKTVYDLLGDLPHRVVPVGRLDLATSGLLIFTNDTQFANWLTDPASDIPRVYLVTVKGEVTDEAASLMMKGLLVGREQLIAADVVVRKRSKRESHLTMTLTKARTGRSGGCSTPSSIRSPSFAACSSAGSSWVRSRQENGGACRQKN